MFSPESADSDLLKAVLSPLLDDFLYWFDRSRQVLEQQPISFLPPDVQADLLARVKQAEQEVRTAKLLFDTTGGQVGVEPAVLAPWHQLVTECWQVAARFRMEQATGPSQDG